MEYKELTDTLNTEKSSNSNGLVMKWLIAIYKLEIGLGLQDGPNTIRIIHILLNKCQEKQSLRLWN